MRRPSSVLAVPRLPVRERYSAESGSAGWPAAALRRLRGWVNLQSARWRLACAGAIALVLFMPMLDGQRAFRQDWANHFWLIAKQQDYVSAHLTPTFFLNTRDLGYFYPFYAFYGGTLYYSTALLALVVHSTWAAYVGTYVLALAVAFYGWLWLSRQASIRGWAALLPGTVFVCAPYYLTNAYGRGAWPEFIAISAIPLALAASWSLLTTSRAPARDFLALSISVVFLTGSHSITLVYGSLFTVAAIAGAAAYRRLRGLKIQRLRLCMVAWALGTGVNAWFLVPLLRYHSEIAIAPGLLIYRAFDQFHVIFSLVPVNPWAESTPQLYVQAPMAPLVATLGVLGLGLYVLRSRSMWILAILAAAPALAVLALIRDTHEWIWSLLPFEARIIQFPYRLNSYFLACIVGLMIAALICIRAVSISRPRMASRMLAVLAVSAIVQFALGQVQVWTAMTYGPADAPLAYMDRVPRETWYAAGDYFSSVVPMLTGADVGLPVAEQRPMDPSETLQLPATGAPKTVGTDIVPSSLVSFDPDLVVGQVGGHAVLQDPGTSAPVPVTVAPAQSPWTLGGTVVSLLSLAGILIVLVWASGLAHRSWTGIRRARTLRSESV